MAIGLMPWHEKTLALVDVCVNRRGKLYSIKFPRLGSTALSRSGGNVTGATALELAHEMIPAGTVVALLVNPTFPPTQGMLMELTAAAQKLGLKLQGSQSKRAGTRPAPS